MSQRATRSEIKPACWHWCNAAGWYIFWLDSELIAREISGALRVKYSGLILLFRETTQRLPKVAWFSINHVRKNTAALLSWPAVSN
jgi:hypothetical protein